MSTRAKALDSATIDRILRVAINRSHYGGAISYEDLPSSIKKYPYCVVINSSERHKPYGHWCCFFAESQEQAFFCDPYGIAPWGRIVTFIKSNIKNALFNKRIVQHFDSEACGYYCIIILKKLDDQFDAEAAMQDFGSDTRLNDINAVTRINRLIEELKI